MATTFSGGTTTTSSFSSTGYPVSINYQRQPTYNRFFAFPAFGWAARVILLIPHIIALIVIVAVNAIMHLAAWVPVLTSGTYPQWAYNWSSGTIRWAVRVGAYYFGLTDVYPPFSLGSNDDGYPVQVAVDYPSNPGKFWAIPLIGYIVRVVALIPHMIVLYILQYFVNLLQLILWAPVLFGGQYPDFGEQFVGGYIRWYARVAAYLFGLSDQYPPFSLSN